MSIFLFLSGLAEVEIDERDRKNEYSLFTLPDWGDKTCFIILEFIFRKYQPIVGWAFRLICES